MGIDFSVQGSDLETPSWSYSNFNLFRQRVAQAVGIDLDEMKGFGNGPTYDGVSWDTVSDDVVPLLNHSDCDGELSPSECSLIAPRLREILNSGTSGFIIPVDPNKYSYGDDVDYYRGMNLVACMEDAVRLNNPLVFC